MTIDTTLLDALIAVTPDPGGYWTKATLQELKSNFEALDAAVLPPAGDNGDVLTVVGGEWTAAAPTGGGGGEGGGLPPIASAAETLVLTVVSGTTTATWAQGTPGPTGATGGFDSIQAIKTVDDDYLLTLADAGALLKVTAQANIVVPPDSAVAFPIGQHIDIVAYTLADVVIASGPGVTIRTPYGNRFKVHYGAATLVKIGADEWLLTGDMEAS